jgi:hypothetical protein
LLDAEVAELACEPVGVLGRVLEPRYDALDLVRRIGNRAVLPVRVVLPACASEADPAPLREDLVANRVLVGVVRVATVLERT